MEMAVRSMETAMEIDGDGAEGTSLSWQGARTETYVPRNCQRRRRWSYGTLSGKLPILLGFSVLRLYIGEGASSGGCQGTLTHRGHGQGLGHATLVCGALVAPLCLLFGSLEASRKNKTSGTCFVQFREYFLCSFSETQK
jgi:hypothetical protein